jgi:hypothetical protein
MAVQYITLEEAAKKLGIPVDEFKRRLKTEWTHIVPMRDGPTLRFRDNQVEELSRQLGAASDPELPLSPMADSEEHGSDDFKVDPKHKNKPKADEPLVFDASDDDIFSLSTDAKSVPLKSSGDSASDSDVRLEVSKMPKKKAGTHDPEAVPTEEIALEASGGPSSAIIKGGSSAKLSAPKSSGKISSGTDKAKSLSNKPGSGDSSEFELSLDADSDDFELQLNTDSSDEVDLGSSPVDESTGRAGKSGINLKSPGDSGVSLEKGRKSDSGRSLKKPGSDKSLKKPPKPDTDSDSDVDFELSLEAEPSTSSGRLAKGPKSGKLPVTSDSDSEFELTLDDSGEGSSLEAAAMAGEESKGDIFETDFEIPPMTDESGSEAVALESDTDLEHTPEMALEEGDVVAEEETGSQVVVLEDEEEGPVARSGRKMKRPVVEEGDVDLADVEEDDASAALAGVRARRHDEDEEEVVTVASGRAAPRPWGPVPAIILFPALLVITLGGLMGFELLHTMMGYQQPRKPAAPLVRGMAKTFDMELKDQ